MMKISRKTLAIATATMLAAGCASSRGSAAGTVIDPADASKTVVLKVHNLSNSPMELRTVESGQSRFIGSVAGNDSTSILLDPTLFPTANLYVVGVPADGIGRAVGGPIAAGKGDQIRFTIEPALDMSRAVVVH